MYIHVIYVPIAKSIVSLWLWSRWQVLCWQVTRTLVFTGVDKSLNETTSCHVFSQVNCWQVLTSVDKCVLTSVCWRVCVDKCVLTSVCWQVCVDKCLLTSVCWQVFVGKCLLTSVDKCSQVSQWHKCSQVSKCVGKCSQVSQWHNIVLWHV